MYFYYYLSFHNISCQRQIQIGGLGSGHSSHPKPLVDLKSLLLYIAERTCKNEDSLPYVPDDYVNTVFDFIPPETYEIMLFAESIDLSCSSGINGLNTSICKIILLHVPDKIKKIYANSMFMGIFPPDWAISTVKLLPKSGDLTNPGNWSPFR